MRCSGFPGNRVELQRAGITASALLIEMNENRFAFSKQGGHLGETKDLMPWLWRTNPCLRNRSAIVSSLAVFAARDDIVIMIAGLE